MKQHILSSTHRCIICPHHTVHKHHPSFNPRLSTSPWSNTTHFSPKSIHLRIIIKTAISYFLVFIMLTKSNCFLHTDLTPDLGDIIHTVYSLGHRSNTLVKQKKKKCLQTLACYIILHNKHFLHQILSSICSNPSKIHTHTHTV